MLEAVIKEVKLEVSERKTDVASFDPDKRIEPGASAKQPHSEIGNSDDVEKNKDREQFNPDSRIKNGEKTEYPPNTSVVEDGKILYTDDHGEVFRIDDDLIPNHTYEINGYKYETDEKGRIVSAEGELRIKNREGRLNIADSTECIGKGDQKKTDDRGHLIADMFDGSNGMENLTPQDSKLNQGEFKSMEQQLAKEVESGKKVEYKVEPVYESDSRRPDAYVVSYSIDGEKSVRVFRNGGEQ